MIAPSSGGSVSGLLLGGFTWYHRCKPPGTISALDLLNGHYILIQIFALPLR